MKSFEDQYLGHQVAEKSPFVFVTKQVEQTISQMKRALQGKFLLVAALSTALVAPLQTITTHLQLSVQPHKNIYADNIENRTKQLARLNTQMTIHQKRNFELLIRAGGKHQPYIAPVYSKLIQTIKGIASHGWKAFYKGLGLRLTHTMCHYVCYSYVGDLISDSTLEDSKLLAVTKSIAVFLICDSILNPVHVLENRHVLQSGLNEFKIFRNLKKDFIKIITVEEGFVGWKFHILNNLLGSITRLPLILTLIYSPNNYQSSLLQLYLLGEFLIFPFQTAYKRMVCQTQRFLGMIPIRYSSVTHALKLMAFEEGVRGLWRGITTHLLGSLIRMTLIKAFMISGLGDKIDQ